MLTSAQLNKVKDAFKQRGYWLEAHNGQDFYCVLKPNTPYADLMGYKVTEYKLFVWFKKKFGIDLNDIIKKGVNKE